VAAGAKINTIINDMSLLHVALLSWNFEAAAVLVDAGADLDARVFPGRLAPLHVAAHFGAYSIVKRIIGKGADVNVKSMVRHYVQSTAVEPSD
jgi:ankyrin repeat protein